MNLDALELTEHPEGGRFREVHRSADTLSLPDGRERNTLTHIYFHLAQGETSRFHRVAQEEVWNLYRGALRLWLWDENTDRIENIELSADANRFCAVIPTGTWQAAEPLDGEALIGCTVAPGFDFADFELMSDDHPSFALLRKRGLDRFLPCP